MTLNRKEHITIIPHWKVIPNLPIHMSIKFTDIVLIEDDPVDTFIAQQLLKKSCDNVKAYKNGRLAIDSLLEMENMPELILLDINMPDMNGFEFLEEFEKLPIEMKSCTTIYMLSSSDDKRDVDKALKYESVKKFITKPLNLDSILRQ